MGPNVTKRNPDEEELTGYGTGEEKYLILHNDDKNTFWFVICSLIEVCGHDTLQAEQCAYITHHRGQCDIKKGGYSEINSMKQSLLDRGLLVTID